MPLTYKEHTYKSTQLVTEFVWSSSIQRLARGSKRSCP